VCGGTLSGALLTVPWLKFEGVRNELTLARFCFFFFRLFLFFFSFCVVCFLIWFFSFRLVIRRDQTWRRRALRDLAVCEAIVAVRLICIPRRLSYCWTA